MKYLVVILLFVGFQSFGQSKEFVELLNSIYDDTPTITIKHASESLYNEGTHFLDAREKNEFNISHIEGAINIGSDSFDISSVSHISKNAEIIIYCSIGARSQTIAKKLLSAGYTNVSNLYGGLFHWANNGYPMVDDQSKSTGMIHSYSKEWAKWVTTGATIY